MVIIAKSRSGELVRVKASDLTEEESAQLGAMAELPLESERPGRKGLNPPRALAPKLAKCGGFSVVSRPGRLPR